MFNTLADILETNGAFREMSDTVEEQIANIQQYSKAYDAIVDWQRYMKDRLDDITILSNFQLKKFKTVLRPWIDLNEMIEDTIKKAQAICGRRWYVVDNIMEILHFPTMDLIENACPPKLMIEQVEHRCDEAKEKIQCLGHISIEDMD